MKTTTFGGGPGKVQSIHRGFDNIVHFLLVQKTNQKRTPVPFGPLGNLVYALQGTPRVLPKICDLKSRFFSGNTLRCFGKRQWEKYFKAPFEVAT